MSFSEEVAPEDKIDFYEWELDEYIGFGYDKTIYLPHIDNQALCNKAYIYQNKEREKRNRIRDWKRTNEKQAKQDLYAWDLICLAVDSLNIPLPKKKVGRPPANISDQLKFAILKIYNKSSFRRAQSFNMLYANSQYTTQLLKRTSINNVFTDDKFTQYLEKLYKTLADFLIPYESTFALDATGFGSRYNSRWVKIKLDFQKHKTYKKFHIVCGTNTHIITDLIISKGQANDCPFLTELLKGTAKRFNIKRVCADAGYLSRQNVSFITHEIKAKPFIMPKKNIKTRNKGWAGWGTMIRLWQEKPEFFRRNYHIRSNVETVFSMMKTTLMDGINCKTETSQKNELLIRAICHNLSVVINSIFRFGIDPYKDY